VPASSKATWRMATAFFIMLASGSGYFAPLEGALSAISDA
jgi:hypothetical protein